MRHNKFSPWLIIAIFISLTPAAAITEPVEVLNIYHEGALISVQLTDYSLADRDREDCFVLFIVISPTEDPFEIHAAILLFETAGGGSHYCFWILENPYFSATWHSGYVNEHFFVMDLQYDFMFSEYTHIASPSVSILALAGIIPSFPVSSETNEFSPILDEFADILLTYNVTISPPVTTSSTTTTSTSIPLSTTTDSISSGIGVLLGLLTLFSVVILRTKKNR